MPAGRRCLDRGNAVLMGAGHVVMEPSDTSAMRGQMQIRLQRRSAAATWLFLRVRACTAAPLSRPGANAARTGCGSCIKAAPMPQRDAGPASAWIELQAFERVVDAR